LGQAAAQGIGRRREILETGMSIGTRLYTWLHGELVGTDQFANRYYRGRSRLLGRPERRWVLYAGDGEPEASRVPPEWHRWLHGTQHEPPKGAPVRRPWQKEHLPNLTGTGAAYRPPGHPLKGGQRAAATGDYEPWTPTS
jgi:NADH:ubiquinone oxidoreductase subunit